MSTFSHSSNPMPAVRCGGARGAEEEADDASAGFARPRALLLALLLLLLPLPAPYCQALFLEDRRLQFGVFVHQDQSCNVFGSMLAPRSRVHIRMRNVSFFNDTAEEPLSTGCTHAAHNLLLLYDGALIVTLSTVRSSPVKKFRYEVSECRGESLLKVFLTISGSLFTMFMGTNHGTRRV